MKCWGCGGQNLLHEFTHQQQRKDNTFKLQTHGETTNIIERIKSNTKNLKCWSFKKENFFFITLINSMKARKSMMLKRLLERKGIHSVLKVGTTMGNQ